MKNSTHLGDGVFRHGEEVSNAQYPMPQAAARLFLCIHKGMKFTAAFNQLSDSRRS
ncbi:hypothetical protein H6G27_30550 [Nostoc linckia FACHB-104]|nr:hypothetical protein [Nostoc linckia FACHB-104]